MIAENRFQPEETQRPVSPPRQGQERGLGTLLHDAVTLMELQGRLFANDLGQFRSHAGSGLILMILGVVFCFATVPVFLLAVGWTVAAWFEIETWKAMLAVTFAAGVLPATGMLILGWKLLQKHAGVLGRSSTELRRNALWLKAQLQAGSGRSECKTEG